MLNQELNDHSVNTTSPYFQQQEWKSRSNLDTPDIISIMRLENQHMGHRAHMD